MLLASFSFVQRAHHSLPRDSVTLDAFLCAFIEQTWESRDPKGSAFHPESGLLHVVLSLLGNLHGSSRLLPAWVKHELLARATPLPTSICCSPLRSSLAKQRYAALRVTASGLPCFFSNWREEASACDSLCGWPRHQTRNSGSSSDNIRPVTPTWS